MKQKDKNLIFHSVTTSERHRKGGYCEPGDFGTVELIKLSPEEKVLIVEFKEYPTYPAVEIVEYNKFAYLKVNKNTNFGGMSGEEAAKWGSLQGKFTDTTALKLVLEMRERAERQSYASAGDVHLLLIGRTLYQRYCEAKNIKITVCCNLSFSHWLSIDIEAAHSGKTNYSFNKKSFEAIFKREKARFEIGKPEKTRLKGDGHVSFSYPKNITWGEKYK